MNEVVSVGTAYLVLTRYNTR